MTPEEIAELITGVKDDGGICTPNSPMGRSRQITQAIHEAIMAERREAHAKIESLRAALSEIDKICRSILATIHASCGIPSAPSKRSRKTRSMRNDPAMKRHQ
jgi:hypothetical protein